MSDLTPLIQGTARRGAKRNRMKIVQRLVPFLALGGALALAAPASAAPSIAGGIFTGNSTDIGGILTDSLSAPVVPAQFQISVGAPLSNNDGRFAATAELVGHGASGYIGGGLGVGQMERNGNTGAMFVGILGTKVAPLTSLELRVYGGGGNDVGSSAFLGLRFGL
ncbi:MAG: hypothetical protein KGM44_11590 [bacterium]|nr:hypothetical protein [bacterium]